MIAADEDALQCDLWETYGVTDYRTLPPTTAARLAVGLRRDSRIRSQMDGLAVPFSTWITAICADRLAAIWWLLLSKESRSNQAPPELIAPALLIEQEIPDTGQFESGADFEAWRTAHMKAS